MTPEFVAALRPVVVWVRRQGWRHERQKWTFGGNTYRLIYHPTSVEPGWCVEVHVQRRRSWAYVVEVKTDSAQRAVDVLAAAGLLPVDLSSVWLAGREWGYSERYADGESRCPKSS